MRAIRLIVRAGGLLAAFLLVLTAFVIVYEAVVRYLGMPTTWAQDMAVYLMIAGGFISAGTVMLEDGHVRVDAFINFFDARVRNLLLAFGLVLSLIYVGVLVWQSLEMTIGSYMIGRMSTSLFRVPTWISESSIVVGSVLLFLAMLVEIVRRFTQPAGPREPSAHQGGL